MPKRIPLQHTTEDMKGDSRTDEQGVTSKEAQEEAH
jgi:hypothetical protein